MAWRGGDDNSVICFETATSENHPNTELEQKRRLFFNNSSRTHLLLYWQSRWVLSLTACFLILPECLLFTTRWPRFCIRPLYILSLGRALLLKASLDHLSRFNGWICNTYLPQIWSVQSTTTTSTTSKWELKYQNQQYQHKTIHFKNSSVRVC